MDILIIFFTTLVPFASARGEYLPSLKGMQELLITCENDEQLAFVLQYQDVLGFDFLKVTRLPRDNVHLLVTAGQVSSFKQKLVSHRIEYKIVTKDFQKVVDEECTSQRISRMTTRSSKFNRTYSFNYFPVYEEINDYLKEVSEKNEDITLFSIGKSYEGREIYGVKISSGGSCAEGKPAIFIDAGIHAREWIAPTTALYIISQLIEKSNRELYKKIEWYILPEINPDGYHFSHSKYRLWRKTRSETSQKECPGVDANRNFGFKWMEVGASSYPCSEIYAGKGPFSEKETQNVRNFFLSLNKTVKAYLTLHSYGQYLLHPWGYTSELPQNEPLLRSLALKAAKALSAVRGTRYTIGSSTNVLYAAAGGSDDWAMAVGGADLSYTIELPSTSFIIPAKQILPVGTETFEAIKVIGQYVSDTYSGLFK